MYSKLMEYRRFLLTGLFIVIVLIGTAVYPLFYDRVYGGVLVGNIQLQGKTLEELTAEVRSWEQQTHGKQLLLYFENTVFLLTPDQVDFSMQPDRTVADAWQYGRVGSWWQRVQDIRYARENGRSFQPYISHDQAKLDQLIDQWKKTLEREPKDAVLSLKTGGVIPEQQGRKLHTEELAEQILQAFYHPDIHTLEIPLTVTEPAVTKESLTKTGIVTLQSAFSTKFDSNDVNRSTNIALAAAKINGLILKPGQIFSFNDAVGPRDTASGFKEAMEIFDSEMVPGIGGGICQVSSTLYNAVLLANLPVKERWNHGRPLSYVGMGRDATVVYGSVDFKFVNNTSSSLMILTETKNNKLTVAIFGRENQENLKQTVHIEVTDLKELPFKTVEIVDPLLPAGQVVLDPEKAKKGAPGYEMNVFRVIKADGKVIKREFLGKDRYVPENAVVRVGPKPPAVQPDSAGDIQPGKDMTVNPALPLNPTDPTGSAANQTGSEDKARPPAADDTKSSR
ncbi:VanW family protein [Acetonema longum]|uniref:VanW family protein n=1 Tax=Acetonema longum TaxID=2374 RepID=UPI001EE63E66|nr:VanW family protein [Acetonema longum]